MASQLPEAGERFRRLEVAERRQERAPDLVFEVAFAPADVMQRDQVAAAVDRTAEHFGRIDVGVANAGFGAAADALEPVTVA